MSPRVPKVLDRTRASRMGQCFHILSGLCDIMVQITRNAPKRTVAMKRAISSIPLRANRRRRRKRRRNQRIFRGTVKPANYTAVRTPCWRRRPGSSASTSKGSAGRLLSPLAPEGTAFELSVWRALQDIPYGRHAPIRRSPGRSASRTLPRRGARQRAQPLSLFIPCHRVIARTNA
jgi:O6-methylguanine-DNA--protein-cysteine methyltransferase